MKKLFYNILICFSLSLFTVSCGQITKPSSKILEKIEITPVSLFYDSLPAEGFQLTLEGKNDTTKKVTLFIKKEDAIEPPIDLYDTITKFQCTVNEIFIDSFINGNYTSKIICTDKTRRLTFNARPIDAIKIAKQFSSPIYIDRLLLAK